MLSACLRWMFVLFNVKGGHKPFRYSRLPCYQPYLKSTAVPGIAINMNLRLEHEGEAELELLTTHAHGRRAPRARA